MSPTFNCPSCGAPLEIDGEKTSIVCRYCGDTVAVPEEFRPRPASAPSPVWEERPPYEELPRAAAPRSSSGQALAIAAGAGILFLIIVLVNLGGGKKTSAAQASYFSNDPSVSDNQTQEADRSAAKGSLLSYQKDGMGHFALLAAAFKPKVSSKDGMAMVFVPAGNFVTGSPDKAYDEAYDRCMGFSDLNAKNNNDVIKFCDISMHIEKARQTVYLSAFWIDQTDVTNAMYARCVSGGKCTPSTFKDDALYNSPDQPVVGVDWNNADGYCSWAGRRLPTAEEWEKAARGTDGRTYPWGNQPPSPGLLNHAGTGKGPSAVGKYPQGASPSGALDMAGNVQQWTADWDMVHYWKQLKRFALGSSWKDSGYSTQTFYQGYFDPGTTDATLGFRCASSAPAN